MAQAHPIFEEHPAAEPPFLRSLFDKVCAALRTGTGVAGYAWTMPENPGEPWVVLVYPAAAEAYGGDFDGAMVCFSLSVDVLCVIRVFSDVRSIGWVSPPRYTGRLDGPEIVIEGVFANEYLRLRLLAIPPPGVEPYFLVDLSTGRAWPKPVNP